MTDNASEWVAVAAAVQQRIDDLHLTLAEVIRRSGVSHKSLQRYLRGEPIVRPDKKAALSTALGWTPSSIDRLLAGNLPAEAATDPSAPEEVRRLTDRLAEVDADIVAADSKAQSTRRVDDIQHVQQLQETRRRLASEIARAHGTVQSGGTRDDELDLQHINSRLDDLVALVAQLTENVDYLVRRAEQDDADVPLAGDEPTRHGDPAPQGEASAR